MNPCECPTECPFCYRRFVVHVVGVTVCPWCDRLIELVLLKLNEEA